MEKELKVGDIVVLVEGGYLNDFGTILAKEKHLFEVEGWSSWNNVKVNIKSISTNLKTGPILKM